MNRALLLTLPLALSAQTPEAVQLANRWADIHGVERELVHAVIEAESAWNPRAVSTAGAAGLMQLMPDTAAAFGVVNRFDANDNIRAGVAYLASLLRLHAGDRRLALASYNAGHAAVSRHGLAYSEPAVLAYVSRVAAGYRRNRWKARITEGGSSRP